MTDDTPSMSTDDIKRLRLDILNSEHRDLDQAIEALETSGRADSLTVRRLKKRKLQLRDQIAKIEDDLTPDIIA